MNTTSRTVGVVIPMFNASATIGETLQGVCNQTYRDLDIVVVDDGSSDRSRQVVEEYCRIDDRIRLFHQENSGVAAARNNGAKHTGAPYLAFLDADDLWAPDKIELQMAALAEPGSEMALVWCWYAPINENSMVRTLGTFDSIEGPALNDLADFFHLGNGSSMLMPRRVFEESGGFDSSLRARGAQGCEDYAFALAVAAKFPFKVVPRYLVGYRVFTGNLSSNTMTMWKSWNLVAEDFGRQHPELKQRFDRQRTTTMRHMLNRSAAIGHWPNAMFFYREIRTSRTLRMSSLTPALSRVAARTMLDTISLGKFSQIRKARGRSYLECAW